MKKRESNFFWVSYTDLMTSLFFIMLVLYVLTIAILKSQQKVTEDKLKKIEEIQNALQSIDTSYFEYQQKYKRHNLKVQISFQPASDIIPAGSIGYLRNVGKSIVNKVTQLKTKYTKGEIKYLIVIEGMASIDNYPYNYELSYKRALSLFNLWKKQGINLDPSICEVLISGSGTGGVGRFVIPNEYKNQRILIQIIPKIGKIEDI